MQPITSREVFNTSLANIWRLPVGVFTVTYDDGQTQEVSQRQLIFDRYCWEMFKIYPETPLTLQCTTAYTIGDGHFNADTHIKLLETIFGHIVVTNDIVTHDQKKPLLKCIMHVIDLIQNEILMQASKDVFTINAMDFINVVNSPEMLEKEASMEPTPEGVEGAYRKIRAYVASDKTDNNFMKAYRAKSINDNQSNQCIGPRGFNTATDRTVYKIPVKNGFIRGMGSLYEMMVESCTSAKSLNATGTLIQQSQYTSRRLQLLSMVVTGSVDGDCGSTNYLPIIVNEQNIDSLKGKYYVTEEGTLAAIKASDKHLYHKLINMRKVSGCKFIDSTRVCTTCLGQVSSNFSNSTNLGYTAASHLMEKITSAILSTKHLAHSVRKSLIKLEGLAVKYFYCDENGDLFFRPDIDLTGMTMMLPNAQVSKLVDVLSLEHTNIGLAKIGELDTIKIIHTRSKPVVSETLNISYKDRNSVITRYLLEHIKASELETDARGNFIVPLTGIDKTKPIFNNPLKEANIINFVNRIASIIETNKDKITDPDEKLGLLFDITQEKFKCNIFILEILIYATTAFNALNGNYKLGRNSPVPSTVGNRELFRNRDFSALGSFEKQMEELRSYPIEAFGNKHKQNHPMAVFYMPDEVINSKFTQT